METTISGVCCRSLRIFEGVLNEWVKTNIRLVEAWRHAGDVPWWYNERASLGVLAAAVWLAGGLAFEEFVSRKRAGRGPYSGRVDLYMENWKRGLQRRSQATLVRWDAREH